MFVNAIETVQQFTRPMHTITRNYGETKIRPGSATLFFVNEDGVAVTCKHVAQMLLDAEQINKQYNHYKAERKTFQVSNNYNKKIKELAAKYKFSNESTAEAYITLVNCATSWSSLEIKLHPTYDLAIIKLINPKGLMIPAFATFLKNTSVLKQGYSMCRLGFPFPEFNNYQYNATEDKIEWTNTGNPASPAFPIDGMLTRHIGDEHGIIGIELSTPGLRGQSGGPLFNKEGLVCGMQSATNHLHLGFDMRQHEIMANGIKIKATNQPFLHVGICIHADVIKNFLREQNIKFCEA